MTEQLSGPSKRNISSRSDRQLSRGSLVVELPRSSAPPSGPDAWLQNYVFCLSKLAFSDLLITFFCDISLLGHNSRSGFFYSSEHQMTNVLTADPTCGSEETHGLAITAIEREGDPHPLTVVAADLKAIGAPAAVARIDGDASVMSPLTPPASRSRPLRSMCRMRQRAAVLTAPPAAAAVRWRALPEILSIRPD